MPNIVRHAPYLAAQAVLLAQELSRVCIPAFQAGSTIARRDIRIVVNGSTQGVMRDIGNAAALETGYPMLLSKRIRELPARSAGRDAVRASDDLAVTTEFKEGVLR